jgi:Flp pilus assembly protein TadG
MPPVTGREPHPASWHRRRTAGSRREDGVISVSMLLIGITALLMAAALVGGGVVFGARAHGYDLAQQAARAGAEQLDLAAYRTSGVLRLDPGAATAAAERFLTAAHATGSVQVTARRVTVTATSRQSTPMLAAFGHATVTVTATASATPTTGPAR